MIRPISRNEIRIGSGLDSQNPLSSNPLKKEPIGRYKRDTEKYANSPDKLQNDSVISRTAKVGSRIIP